MTKKKDLADLKIRRNLTNIICKSCDQEFPSTKEFFYFRTKSKTLKSGIVKQYEYPSADCLGCERKKSSSSRRDRYSSEGGKLAISAQNKKYRDQPEKKERIAKINRDKYLANSAAIKLRISAYKAKPENKARRNALWREKYLDERDQRRLAFKTRYHSDPEFRLRGNIRKRIHEALRLSGSSKDRSILDVLPYSLNQLVSHIEKQFQDGMSWNDSKSFCIDHIIPQIMFPLSGMDDPNIPLCWSLDNLRPLPPPQNYSEGDRKHLFSGCRTFSELLGLVRSWDLGSDVEDHRTVFNALKEARILDSFCPQSLDGLGILDEYFSHRFDSYSRSISPNAFVLDDKLVLKILCYIVRQNKPISRRLFVRNLHHYVKTPSHFFPSSASAIVNKYASKGHTFDPFLGWGGRTLGSICAGAASISGTDIQSKSVLGCMNISRLFNSVSPHDGEFFCDSFSNYMSSTSKKFNLILTSPPFFDTEYYGHDFSYRDDSWKENILTPFVSLSKRILIENGHVAFHVQDRPKMPIGQMSHNAFISSGFSFVEKLKYGKTSGQAILVFRV